MVVDALVIDGSYLEPSDPFLVLELAGCIPDNVFNENRVVVGLHGDIPLVCALKQRVNGSGG